MWRIAIMTLLALAVALPSHAKVDKYEKQNTKQESKKPSGSGAGLEKTFSPAERNLIRAQLQQETRIKSKQKHQKLPPGLQKKLARGKELPPGWQKKITPGKSLDYHIYRQGQSLPEEILRQLPPTPIGSEILLIEDKIIRVNSATRTILDAFDLTPGN